MTILFAKRFWVATKNSYKKIALHDDLEIMSK